VAGDQEVALDVKTPGLPPTPVFNPASPLLQAQAVQEGQTNLQMLNRQNAGQDIQFRNQLIANAAAHALDANSWDEAMTAAAQKGAPEAQQFVGRYTPLLQQRLFDAYSGGGGQGGAAPAAATGGSNPAATATPTDQLDRMYANVSPQQMAQSLQKNNMILQALSTVKDADSYNRAIGWLAQNGIPNAAQIAGPYNPLQVLRLWNDTQARVGYLQSRVASAATGAPNPLVKNEVQNIGDTGYSVDPYKGTATAVTPSKPQVIQDPIMGPRTILPDKTGQWVYADTNEPVVPSQAPAAAGVSIADAAARIQPTENTTGNPAATNPRSTAMGNDQFIDKTWLDTVKAARPELAKSLTDNQILALRAEPSFSAAMTVELAKSNAAALAKADIPVTTATIALAHKFGADGATKIFDANPNTPMEQIVSDAVLKANPELKGQTAGAYVKNLVTQVGNDPVNTTASGQGGATAPIPGIPPSDDPSRPFKNATVPTGATMIKAQQMGLHGQAFLDSIPAQIRNDIEAVGNYDQPLSVFSKYGRAGMSQDRALGWVRQFNPDYDSYWASAKGSSLKEFLTGGPNSPSAQIRSYNTAIGHAGDAYDALQEMKRVNPGFLQDAQKAGIPFVSYAAAQLQNKAIQGTPMGAALNKYVTASTLYGSEVAKLYSGSIGSQEERNTIRAPLDQNKSVPEIEAGLQTSTHMMGSRANALEDQYRVAMDAPGLAQYGTKGDIKDFPVLHDRAQSVLAKIGTGAAPVTANAPPVPGAKLFQGTWYTRGPNGEAVPVKKAGS
jgi:hypothetical protein